MNEVKVARDDVYCHERADLRERLEILGGRGSWREPNPGAVRRPKALPYEHALAAGLAYARDRSGPHVDPGPDILESLVYRRVVHGDRIATALTDALRDMSSKLARADAAHVRRCSIAIIGECIHGRDSERPPGVPNQVWIAASALGIRLLWASAGQTLAAAQRALK